MSETYVCEGCKKRVESDDVGACPHGASLCEECRFNCADCRRDYADDHAAEVELDIAREARDA